MYLSIIFLPLLGAFIAGFFGRFIGAKGASLLTTSFLSITAIFSLVAFYEVGLLGSPCYIKLGPWINSEMFHASWGFLFDSLTVVMLVVVTSVSTLVHLYSIEYMADDPHRPRFMAYLSLFTFFMLILVTADNFIQMFLGWEGVGLASYLLINFWFTRLQANKSAIKAMVVNRVGDFGLALGIMAIFATFHSVDYSTVFSTAYAHHSTSFLFLNFEVDLLTIICLLLFVGAVGKSAQVGLHTWLPDAMEGPTPVSALIHAATMVTAGIFMIVRCSPLFEYAPTALTIVVFFGAITAFFAATTGLVQNDLKKVIAYSTCSQLGYMIFACGISNYSVGMFHLANHAFFKALLFLSAGSIIHGIANEQDMRKMGGLLQLLPFTYSMMVIGSLSLMGFPFLTGFYSKDVILELAYTKYSIEGHFAHWLGCISAFFTAFYSFRLLYLTFITKTNGYRQYISSVHESPILMSLPLGILAIGSIFVGYLTKDMIIGLGTNFWGNSIFTLPENVIIIDSEFIPTYIKLIPTILSISGAILAFIINHYYNKIVYYFHLTSIGRNLYNFLSKKWYFDKIYNSFIGAPLLKVGYDVTFKTLDKGLIEMLGPHGISTTVSRLIKQISILQTGFIYHYAFIMLLGVTFFISFIALGDTFFINTSNKLYLVYLISLLFLNRENS
nr:NADH dehydrogenase subunit 5 [Microheliella maris]